MSCACQVFIEGLRLPTACRGLPANCVPMFCYLLALGTTAAVPTATAAAAPARVPPATTPALQFSAGFSDSAVLQRGDRGTAVYGFATSASPVKLMVSGGANYEVSAKVSEWVDDSGCNSTICPAGKKIMPAHGGFVWRAQLRPQPLAGGEYSLSVTSAAAGSNGTLSIVNLTYGDVFFCSGQSNMDLEIYFTFSVDELFVLNPSFSTKSIIFSISLA